MLWVISPHHGYEKDKNIQAPYQICQVGALESTPWLVIVYSNGLMTEDWIKSFMISNILLDL